MVKPLACVYFIDSPISTFNYIKALLGISYVLALIYFKSVWMLNDYFE